MLTIVLPLALQATFDCIKSREDSAEASLKVLKHVFELLRPGGLYVMISASGPDERLSDLQHENGPKWGKIEVTDANHRIAANPACRACLEQPPHVNCYVALTR